MSRQIEPFPAGVAAPLAAMHQACFPDEPWDAASLERILALSGAFGLLDWEGADPAGFALARDLGGEIEILSLGVLPRWRRQGVGRALLDRLAAEAARRGARSLVLEVKIDNDPARRLYAAFGFVEVGRRPRYYHSKNGVSDALILRRGVTGKA